jgi:hypothetical protein
MPKTSAAALESILLALSQSLRLTPESQAFRQSILQRQQEILRQLYPTATITPIGSFAHGTSLHNSGLDLAICLPDPAAQLPHSSLWGRELAKLNYEQGLHSRDAWRVIPGTHVPLLNYHVSEGAESVDVGVSFQRPGNLSVRDDWVCAELNRKKNEAGDNVGLAAYLLLKSWLKRVGLDKPYTGGLGSYGLALTLVGSWNRAAKRYERSVKSGMDKKERKKARKVEVQRELKRIKAVGSNLPPLPVTPHDPPISTHKVLLDYLGFFSIPGEFPYNGLWRVASGKLGKPYLKIGPNLRLRDPIDHWHIIGEHIPYKRLTHWRKEMSILFVALQKMSKMSEESIAALFARDPNLDEEQERRRDRKLEGEWEREMENRMRSKGDKVKGRRARKIGPVISHFYLGEGPNEEE